MASQHVNANIAFSEFSKNISISIFSRILGIFSFLLIISSGIFLILCYWLLTGSKYIEYCIVQLTINHDSTSIKNVFDNTIQLISDKINQITPWNIIPASNIKKETCVIYETRMNNKDTEVSDVEISDTEVSDVEISDTEVSDVEISDIQDSYDNIETILDSSDSSEQDTESLTGNDSDTSDIEDVTEQCIAEREKSREIIDLSDENE
jgi:hypothetical protein